MTNHSRTLYVGVTNDLERRIWEHKQQKVEGFTKHYRITRLVHYEEFSYVDDALACEKQIKGWLRSKKVALIEDGKPNWNDLSAGWYGGDE